MKFKNMIFVIFSFVISSQNIFASEDMEFMYFTATAEETIKPNKAIITYTIKTENKEEKISIEDNKKIENNIYNLLKSKKIKVTNTTSYNTILYTPDEFYKNNKINANEYIDQENALQGSMNNNLKYYITNNIDYSFKTTTVKNVFLNDLSNINDILNIIKNNKAEISSISFKFDVLEDSIITLSKKATKLAEEKANYMLKSLNFSYSEQFYFDFENIDFDYDDIYDTLDADYELEELGIESGNIKIPEKTISGLVKIGYKYK